MASNGIQRLIEITQMKANSANDEALQGAEKQRELMDKQKVARNAKRALDDAAADGFISQEEWARMQQFHGAMYDIGLQQTHDNRGPAFYWTNGEHTEMKIGEETEWQKKNKNTIDRLSKVYEDFGADLDAQDKMGNFQIQDLMARYNEANTLASSVQKKDDDTQSSIIGKI